MCYNYFPFQQDSGLFPAQYAMEDIQSHGRNRAALDHNHTHFILVDDGTDGKFGVEIEFRAKLESYISSIVETGVAKNQSEYGFYNKTMCVIITL